MRRSRTLPAIAAVGLSLLLSACGGSDDPPTRAAQTLPSSASPTAVATATSSGQPTAATEPTAPPSALGLPTIALASTDTAGKPAEFGASQAVVSGDGTFLAYRTPALDGAPGGTPASILVRDLRSDAVVPACTSADDKAANATCDSPALSFDGKFVAFASTATNLVPEDKDPDPDVFRKDLRSAEIVLVTSGTKKAPGSGAGPSISADGRTVAFASEGQIYLKDLGSDAVTLVSRTTAGKPGDAASESPKMSADASTVAFRSRATDLAGKPRYENGDVLIATVATGRMVNLEKLLKLKLPKFNHILGWTAPTRIGGRIAYSVGIDTLSDDGDGSIEGSSTDKSGVFVADLNRATVIHTVRTAEQGVDHKAGCEALSADGKRLAYCTFTKKRKKMGSGYSAYLADVGGNTTVLMSGPPTGTASPDARPEAISADGAVVAFRSDDPQRGVDAETKESRYQMYVARPVE